MVAWNMNGGMYPSILQQKWELPVGKLYGYSPPEAFGFIIALESDWKKVWNSYREYIQKSILNGRVVASCIPLGDYRMEEYKNPDPI
jgi:hypothetical protein